MSPAPFNFLSCVLLFVGLLGWMLTSSSSSSVRLCSSWIEQSSHSVSSLNTFLNEPDLVPDQLDLSLCTVGTSSAFLQTADNICLLTCTVTRRTLQTLQIILPPTRSPLVCPVPPDSPDSKLRRTWTEHKPGPSPQAASSRCKLKPHLIFRR